MDTQWFYIENGQRRGPVPFEELVGAVLAAPEPGRVQVWREGLPEWQEAEAMPEISGRLPPSDPSIRPDDAANRTRLFQDAEAIARLYRRLVLLVGAQMLGYYANSSAKRSPFAAVAVVILVVLIGILVAQAVTAYKLTRHLGDGAPILWAVAMFLPCVNLIVLLVLSSRAQTWCRLHGIKVGFLGPTKESIEELRRRIETSTFE
jgi:hypothetical protein